MKTSLKYLLPGLLFAQSALALPPTVAGEGKFLAVNLRGFTIQSGVDFSVSSAPQTIGPAHHYRFDTRGTVHGTGLISTVIPAGTDINTAFNTLDPSVGDGIRGYVFESDFGDNYPLVNKTINGSVFPFSLHGRIESGVTNGVGSFAVKDFVFSALFLDVSQTKLIFDDVLLIGENMDVVKSDFDFDANSDLVLYNSKKKQVSFAFLSSTSFLKGKAAKSISVALGGKTLPAGFGVAGVSDFDQDGNIDLLLYNSKTRQTEALLMKGTGLKGATVAASLIAGPTLPAGFKLGGVGDFNLDGNFDLIAYSPSSLATSEILLTKNMGLLGGTLEGSSTAGPNIVKGFDIVGVSDFNDDGIPDLLLFNAKTRASKVILSSGQGTLTGPTLPKDWVLVGSAGFDNNRSLDLVSFKAKTGQVQFYVSKGATFAQINKKPTKALTLPAGLSVVGPR